MSVCLNVCVSVCLSVCVSVCISVCMCPRLQVYCKVHSGIGLEGNFTVYVEHILSSLLLFYHYFHFAVETLSTQTKMTISSLKILHDFD